MKKTTIKKKPVKLEPQWIKLKLIQPKEIEVLETIKKLTKEKTASKAVYEALVNYPQISKRADGLNAELQKVSRDYEQLSMKFDTVKRAFKIIGAEEADENHELEDDISPLEKCDNCLSILINGQCDNCD